MAPLTENLIRDMGWRGAAIVLSAISVASLPIAAMFFFSKRGAYIASDANEHMAVKIDEIAQSAGSDWKLLASSHGFRVLIITALAILGGGITTVALFSHINGLMKEAGFDSEFLGYVVGILSVTAVIGSLLIGWMMDNVRPFWSALSVSFIFITGLLLYFLMLQSPSKTLAIAGTASLGLSFAAGELMWINLLRRTVAPNLFSTAYGGWYFAVQVGYASGGAIVGMIIDRFHSIGLIVTMLLLYIPAMLMSVILALAIQKRDKFII